MSLVFWLTLRALKALAGVFFLSSLGISRINLKKYGSWAGILKSVHNLIINNYNHCIDKLALSLPLPSCNS